VLALIWLMACTGENPEDSADTDTDTDTDTTPTDDSGTPAPVWDAYRIETSSTLQGVYASGEGVYVVGTGGKAWVGDATSGWTAMSDPPVEENDLTDLWGQGSGAAVELFATGHAGYVAHYSSEVWTVEDLGTSNHEGIGGSANALYAVSWGGIYHYDGASWTFEAPPGSARLNDVWASGDTAVAVGEGGVVVMRTPPTDSGSTEWTWTEIESGTEADLNAIDGSSATDLWVAGADGTVLHFDGVGFTTVDVGTTAALWAVFAPEPDAAYVVGSNGTARFFDGNVWASLPTGVDNNLYAMSGVNAQNVWAVGNRGVLLQYKAD
jgi:hypothetical protein